MNKTLTLILFLALVFLALMGNCYEDYGWRCWVTENGALIGGIFFLASFIYAVWQKIKIQIFFRSLLWSAIVYLVSGIVITSWNLFFINTDDIISWLPLLVTLWPKILLFPL